MIGLLGSLLGGRGGRMIGGMIGGRNGAMIGGLIGSIVGGRRLGRGLRRSGGLGGLGGLIGGKDDGAETRSSMAPAGAGGGVDQALSEADAELLVKAMANAAKSDGHVDRDEVDAILGQVQDASDEEMEFLNRELTSPFVAADRFAAMVPADLAYEAYVVSASAVTVDTEAESRYLQELAAALEIDADDRRVLHDELGIPAS